MSRFIPLILALICAPSARAVEARGERIPVELEISPEVMDSIPPARRAVVRAIQEDVRTSLWRWDVGSFRYELPTTEFSAEFVPGDLFRTPDAGELPVITRDANGARIPFGALSQEQTDRIHEFAEIVVPSRAFPGKNHVWKIRPFFQTGANKIKVTFKHDKAFAYDQIFVQIPARLKREHPLNVPDGVVNFVAGLVETLQAVVGFAETANVFSDAEISRQLRAHAEERVREISSEKLDLRLLDPRLASAIDQEVHEIIRRFDQRWPRVREDLLLRRLPELRATGLEKEALTDAARAWLGVRRTELIHEKVASDSTLEKLSPGVGRLLVDRSRASLMAEKAFEAIDADVEAHRQDLIAQWSAKHTVRGLVPGEASRAVKAGVSEFSRARWHEGIDALVRSLRANGLEQDAQILATTFAFYLDQADEIAQRLTFEKKPAREAVVSRKLWNPADWIVTKAQNHEGYDVNDRRERRITSHVVGWRAELAAVRTWYNAKAQFDRLWTGLILNGSCGWRATFGDEEFCAFDTVDRETGRIVPDPRSLRTTPRSVQRGIRKNIAELKESFERQPEGDVFSKDFVRPWVYTPYTILHGVLTVGNYGGRGLGFLTSMIFGGLGIAATPVTAPLYGLAHWFLVDTFWRDSARDAHGRYPISPLGLHLGLQTIGGGVSAVAAAAAIPVHAAVGTVGLGIGSALYGLHTAWDEMWFSIMKSSLYLPMNESGVVTQRIQGPGHEKNYEFRIEPRLALAQLRAKLEDERLKAVVRRVENVIAEPVRAAEVSVNDVYRSVHLRAEGAPWFQGIRDSSNNISQRFQRDVQAQRAKLPRIERHNHRIRLAAADVMPTLDAAEEMTREFWGDTADQFDWTGASLAKGDFRGLAEHHLIAIFGKDILTPLAADDDTQVYEQPTPNYGRAIEAALDGRRIEPADVNGDIDRDLIKRTARDLNPRHATNTYWSLGESCDKLLLRWTNR